MYIAKRRVLPSPSQYTIFCIMFYLIVFCFNIFCSLGGCTSSKPEPLGLSEHDLVHREPLNVTVLYKNGDRDYDCYHDFV